MKLLRQGMKLAVLGVDDTPGANRQWWHVVRPGSYSIPQMQGTSEALSHGTSLCGKYVATNGYASDFAPADNVLCPRCKERL